MGTIIDADGQERDHLVERLHNLRTVLPVMAEELASARRQAASLRVENRRLVEQVRRLQAAERSRSMLALARAPRTAQRQRPVPTGR